MDPRHRLRTHLWQGLHPSLRLRPRAASPDVPRRAGLVDGDVVVRDRLSLYVLAPLQLRPAARVPRVPPVQD